MRYLGGLVVCSLLLVLSALVWQGDLAAQTPDGVPPANEGVCDDLIGATPGLYGLCVAYCEAQDCTDDDPVSAQCRIPNPAILANYNKKKRVGDPDMPCVKKPCPCWTEDELENFRWPASGDEVVCLRDFSTNYVSNRDLWTIKEPTAASHWTELQTFGLATDGTLRCRLRDTCTAGDCLGVVRLHALTPEEFQVCEAQVNASGGERGISCSMD